MLRQQLVELIGRALELGCVATDKVDRPRAEVLLHVLADGDVLLLNLHETRGSRPPRWS